MRETASDLKGVLIVAREEGAQLGTISGIYVSPERRALSGIGLRSRGLGRKEFFVGVDAIDRVGRDVIFVVSEHAAKPIEEVADPGRSLKELQGEWVTTMDGRHLGTLVDVDFSPDSWQFSELTLAEGKHLPVNPAEIRIADEIIVPTAYLERVQDSAADREGLMSRAFGEERMKEMKESIRRALRRMKRNKKKDEQEGTTKDEVRDE